MKTPQITRFPRLLLGAQPRLVIMQACRICLDGDAPDDPLISPCVCRGASRYAHLSCLRTWAEVAGEAAFHICPTCKQRYFGEAGRSLSEACVQRCEVHLGADHIGTLEAKMILASLLKTQGEVAEARRLNEGVLEGYTRQLGADHTDTLRAKMNLANLLKRKEEQT